MEYESQNLTIISNINIEGYEKLHNYELNQRLREWYLSPADSVWKLKELVHLDMRQMTNIVNSI